MSGSGILKKTYLSAKILSSFGTFIVTQLYIFFKSFVEICLITILSGYMYVKKYKGRPFGLPFMFIKG